MPSKTRTKQTGVTRAEPTLIQDDTPVMYAALLREYEALRAAYDTLLSHYQGEMRRQKK